MITWIFIACGILFLITIIRIIVSVKVITKDPDDLQVRLDVKQKMMK